jgi:hypothetical protein
MMESREQPTAAGDRRALDEAFGSDPLEPLTAEAIEDNPWLAVVRDLPIGADAETILAAACTADAMIERATQWANQATDPVDKEQWLDLIPMAEKQLERAANFWAPSMEPMSGELVCESYPALSGEESEVTRHRDPEIPGRGR